MKQALVASILLLLLSAGWASAGPRVDVVIGPRPHPLEKLAAQELADQFKLLFEAEVHVSDRLPAEPQNLILVGSPATNPTIERFAGERWPKLTDQGHLVRSISMNGAAEQKALLVGGGNPVATLWAVYELGHHFGIRSFIHGDVPPAVAPELKLDKLDIVMEPVQRLRTWRTVNDFAIGPESWGLAEQKQVLRQLAKLKFNRVMIAVYPWQPFAHYEFKGVKKSTGMLWYGWRYRVDGDTPGRSVFGGAKEFENPDFAGKTDYAQRLQAGVRLVRGIIDQAHDLGMSASISFSPLEFPKEFAAVLPKAQVLHQLESLTVGPGAEQAPDDPVLKQLARAQIRAYLDTYPAVDAIHLTMSEFPGWVEHHEKAWQRLDARTGISKRVTLAQLTQTARKRKLIASGDRGVRALQGNITALEFFHNLLADPGLLVRKDGRKVEVVLGDIDPALYSVLDSVLPAGASTLNFINYTARRTVLNQDLLGQAPSKKIKSSLILTLADDNVGVLPQLATSQLHTLLGTLRQHGWEGYSTRYWIPGDLNPSIHYLSRASFDAKLTPHAAYADLLDPILGPGASPRVIKGLDMIEEATALIDQNDIGFTFPVPGVVMKHYVAGSPPPAWWKKVSGLYAGAMDELYRGITRSRGGARPILLYHAKRLEFAVHYMSSIESLRLAGQAKKIGDTKKQQQLLDQSVESMYNALNALGDMARDNSDRGVIAVMTEYGYRPLRAEFDAVRRADKKK